MNEHRPRKEFFLGDYRVAAKKSLGQNFLIDKNIASKIISSCAIAKGKEIIEVGPGAGALTELLIENGAEVYAVELDSKMCEILEDRFRRHENFHLKNADILKIELSDFNLKSKATLIGNLPFYISSQIIAKFLPALESIDNIFVTIQKELAERLICSCGTRQSSAFSLYCEFYSKPEILFNIKKTCFKPIPKVDASFLKLSLCQRYEPENFNKEMLFWVIRTAFKQRRKTILNSLRSYFDTEKLKTALNTSNIDPRRRPETLLLSEYIVLSQNLKLSGS